MIFKKSCFVQLPKKLFLYFWWKKRHVRSSESEQSRTSCWRNIFFLCWIGYFDDEVLGVAGAVFSEACPNGDQQLFAYLPNSRGEAPQWRPTVYVPLVTVWFSYVGCSVHLQYTWLYTIQTWLSHCSTYNIIWYIVLRTLSDASSSLFYFRKPTIAVLLWNIDHISFAILTMFLSYSGRL